MEYFIPDSEFTAYEANQKKILKNKFSSCFRKIKINEIAKATGLRWETVDALRCGKNVTFSTICKVEYFFKKKGLL